MVQNNRFFLMKKWVFKSKSWFIMFVFFIISETVWNNTAHALETGTARPVVPNKVKTFEKSVVLDSYFTGSVLAKVVSITNKTNNLCS
jgi:hypothetical protein